MRVCVYIAFWPPAVLLSLFVGLLYQESLKGQSRVYSHVGFLYFLTSILVRSPRGVEEAG